jgi:hypothetical protein
MHLACSATPAARVRRALAAAALVLCALPAAAHAQPAPRPLALGEWVEFSWWDGVGSVAEPGDGFLLDLLQPVRLRLTDAFSAGDAFDLFVNGTLALSTPTVAGDDAVDAATGDAAWADARLSRGALVLGPGRHVLTVGVRETAPGWDYGSGFLRADLAADVPPTTVPEPATVVLLGAGCVAVGAVARRRRAATGGAR